VRLAHSRSVAAPTPGIMEGGLMPTFMCIPRARSPERSTGPQLGFELVPAVHARVVDGDTNLDAAPDGKAVEGPWPCSQL